MMIFSKIKHVSIISLTIASILGTAEAGVVTKALTAKKMGPAKKPFINGVTGDTRHISDADLMDMARNNVNGLRFWLSLTNFDDPINSGNGRDVLKMLHNNAARIVSKGFDIVLTIDITDKFNKGNSPQKVQSGMAKIVNHLKGNKIRYQLGNELAHKPYYTNDTGDITKDLHYANRIYVPMAKAIRQNDSTAKVILGSTWCGSYASKIYNQLFSQIVAVVKADPSLAPDGADCHTYRNSAKENLSAVKNFRAAMDNQMINPLKAVGKLSRPVTLDLTEFNCLASPLKHSTSPNHPNARNADACLQNIYVDSKANDGLYKYADSAFYFTYYPYAKRPNDDAKKSRNASFLKGTDLLFQ